MATAIGCPHKMPWTTYPRINVGLRPIVTFTSSNLKRCRKDEKLRIKQKL